MNLRFTLPFALALLSAISIRADENLPLLQAGNDVYSNVTVLSVSATDVYFTYNNGKGMANVKLKSLSPELQKHFRFNSAKASKVEKAQTRANAQYQQEIVKTPLPLPPDESRTRPTSVAYASGLTWSTDFNQALDRARAEGKMVLLDFTGSDWCPWCIKFDHDVLETGQFATYARAKLELVKVDFPHGRPQSEARKQANKLLARRYHVIGFPTLVLVNYAGNEFGRQVGYLRGGPNAFITKLERLSHQ